MADHEDEGNNVGLTPSERRKLRSKQKKDEKTKMNEEIKSLIDTLRQVFSDTNRLIPSKLPKVEILADGEPFNKRYVTQLQNLYLEDMDNRIKAIAQRTIKPRQKDTSRGNNYSKPFYFRDQVVDWLLDPRVRFFAENLAVKMTNEDFTELVPYDGSDLSEILLMTKDISLTVDDKYEIPSRGLANKNILSDLLNCYMTQHKLKGVPVKKTVKKKKGSEEISEVVETINNSYWRPDEVILEYFGDCIDSIVEKSKGVPNDDGIIITRNCIKNSSMSILAQMADVERNKEYGKLLSSSTICEIIDADTTLVHAVYTSFRK